MTKSNKYSMPLHNIQNKKIKDTIDNTMVERLYISVKKKILYSILL